MTAPDDLIPGKRYAFTYRTHTGRIFCQRGEFLRISIEVGVLWLWWRFDYGDVPFDYGYLDCQPIDE